MLSCSAATNACTVYAQHKLPLTISKDPVTCYPHEYAIAAENAPTQSYCHKSATYLQIHPSLYAFGSPCLPLHALTFVPIYASLFAFVLLYVPCPLCPSIPPPVCVFKSSPVLFCPMRPALFPSVHFCGATGPALTCRITVQAVQLWDHISQCLMAIVH